ncbi:glycerophosphodiester phosphodiesterase [Bacillus sp. JCM 19034]|uniref:glycerophosphodiester phosphodiesterase n=1 Tax=Bacillus sp. JCM 19034 TaxID=1481928 RepID=UPI000781676A|nr:glycerophosphodiester phosphodiesterase [Bacillus sp. JCM 19034]
MKQQTAIFAHRGFSARYPENTMDAFRAAHKFGADGIELDVQLTKDKIPIIIHDETIDRTTNGTGYVKDYTLNELKQWNTGTQTNNDHFGSIPSLEEYFKWVQQTDLVTNIELKNGIILYDGLEEIVLSLINEYQLENKVIISSFNHYSLAEVSRLNPKIETAILFLEGLYKPWDYARTVGASGLHCYYPIAQKPLVEQALVENIAVRPFTVNSEDDLTKMISFNCSAIITDHVDKAVAIRNQLQDNG